VYLFKIKKKRVYVTKKKKVYRFLSNSGRILQ
jgi:hypothetical protein